MKAERTSETSVNFNVSTRRYIPENSKFHGRPMFLTAVQRPFMRRANSDQKYFQTEPILGKRDL
jgi:hypothetical protein